MAIVIDYETLRLRRLAKSLARLRRDIRSIRDRLATVDRHMARARMALESTADRLQVAVEIGQSSLVFTRACQAAWEIDDLPTLIQRRDALVAAYAKRNQVNGY